MCFVQNFREFVSDCITKRGRCLVVFDQLGYHHTTMYLDKVNSADVMIRDDGCLWNSYDYLCRQLLYDGMHIRSVTIPLCRKKWTHLMNSEVILNALKTHRTYICKMYQYASCFYETRDRFESLYLSDVWSFRDFCINFLSLCAWSLDLRIMHVSISEILWSFSVDDCFWWWIPSASGRHSRHIWKQTFIDAFQKLVWDTMSSQIRVLIPKLSCSGLYQQALRRRNIIEEVQILLSKNIDVVACDIVQPVYRQSHSIWRPFVPHLWLLDFFFNYGFSWYRLCSGCASLVVATSIY